MVKNALSCPAVGLVCWRSRILTMHAGIGLPIAARAQAPMKLPRVGILTPGRATLVAETNSL
jgi:hypothetical protein